MISLARTIEYGFYLFLFLLPWQTRLIWREAKLNGFTWEYGRFSLYATQLLLLALLLLYGVWLARLGRLRLHKFTRLLARFREPAVLIYWFCVALVAVAGLSLLWALDVQIAYYRWLVLAQAVALMSFVTLFDLKLEKIAVAFVASAAVQGIFAIWQFLTQYVPANKWFGLAEHLSTIGGSIILQTDSERWLRAYGSLPHPNILAGWLVVGVLFLLYLALRARTMSQRLFVLASLVAMVPAIFFTFGRSAWIALLFTLILLGFWLTRQPERQWRGPFWQIIFLITLMTAILGLNLSGPFVTRLQGIEPLEVNSIQLRFTFTEQAWQLIKHHPLGGVGIGNYTLGVQQEINSTWPGYYYQPVHNIFLLALAELGLLGAVIFFSLLGMLLWTASRSLRTLEQAVVLLGLVAALTISLFDHYFWTLEFGVLFFWLLVGLNLKQLKRSS